MLPGKTFESSDTVPAKSSAGKAGLRPPPARIELFTDELKRRFGELWIDMPPI